MVYEQMGKKTCINFAKRMADLSVKLHPTNDKEAMDEFACKPEYKAMVSYH